MKKIFALILALVMVLSLAACGGDKDNAVADEDTEPTNTTVETTSNSTETTQGTTELSTTPTKVDSPSEPPKCAHSFSNATCTAPSACSKCGETVGLPIGHTYSPATCDAPQKCTMCGITNGNALGHDFTGGRCTRCGYDDPEKEAQYASAYQAYLELNQTAQGIDIIMDSVYNGWHFAIYKADNYSTAKDCITAFCNTTGLDYGEVVTAINEQIKHLGYEVDGITQMAVLRTFSNAVEVVVRVYSSKGWYEEFYNGLSIAQNDIMALTSKYEDITGYSTLKKYYSEVFAYSQFAASPSGSFSHLESTMNAYKTNIRKYNNELAFLFLF